jgi:hypothetical protein
VIDLVSEEEMDMEEVEISRLPPASDMDLEDEDEKEPEPMDTSEDNVSEQVELEELEELIFSFEEYRDMARDSSLWAIYWRGYKRLLVRLA